MGFSLKQCYKLLFCYIILLIACNIVMIKFLFIFESNILKSIILCQLLYNLSMLSLSVPKEFVCYLSAEINGKKIAEKLQLRCVV